MVDVARSRASYAEYLALEAASEHRHEFVSGEILAMSGGSIEHARLIARMTALLDRGLGDRRCVVMPSDARVRIRAADRATYPDLHIVCDEVKRDPDDDHAVINPTVIVEVLSDSTAGTDRDEKFAAYRRLVSLREYVLVSQRERRVDVFRRDGKRWQLDEYGGGEQFALASVGVEIAIDELYVDRLGPIL